MPGEYPPGAECCIWEDEAAGIECARKVEHSFAVHGPDGTLRYFFCQHHWDAGAKHAVQTVAEEAAKR